MSNSEENSEERSGGGQLKVLFLLLILSLIGFAGFKYGVPYFNSHFRRHIAAAPTPPPHEEAPTPTPRPTPKPSPTPAPTPTLVPTPTPKPTIWTPPAPDQVYPDGWACVTSDMHYEHVKVLYVEPDRVTINCDQGTIIVQISTLEPDLQKRLNYDPDLAGQAAAKRDLDRVNDEVKRQND